MSHDLWPGLLLLLFVGAVACGDPGPQPTTGDASSAANNGSADAGTVLRDADPGDASTDSDDASEPADTSGEPEDGALTPDTRDNGMVGAEGGTVEGPDGITLVVPPGALSEATAIAITVDADASAPLGYSALSPVYRFEPAGLTFAEPATISLPWTGDEGAAIFWASDLMSPPSALSTTHDGAYATALVDHFSIGFVGRRSPGVGRCMACPSECTSDEECISPGDGGMNRGACVDVQDEFGSVCGKMCRFYCNNRELCGNGVDDDCDDVIDDGCDTLTVCSHDGECSGKEICREGVCSIVPGTMECTAAHGELTTECAFEYCACRDGECWGCEPGFYCTSTGACVESSPDGGSVTHSSPIGACVHRLSADGSTHSTYCSRADVRTMGFCERTSATDSCETRTTKGVDDDCDGVVDEDCPTPCVVDSDCLSGTVCGRGGRCVLCEDECTQDSDCSGLIYQDACQGGFEAQITIDMVAAEPCGGGVSAPGSSVYVENMAGRDIETVIKTSWFYQAPASCGTEDCTDPLDMCCSGTRSQEQFYFMSSGERRRIGCTRDGATLSEYSYDVVSACSNFVMAAGHCSDRARLDGTVCGTSCVLPCQNSEICLNGVDDNCDGAIDEDCNHCSDSATCGSGERCTFR